MHDYDVIIIGAGASGLAAASVLAKANRKVLVLEARDRMGGRIHTINDSRFSLPVEAGAEFVHGKLPQTLQLFKKAGIKYHPVEGKMWRMKNGEPVKTNAFVEGEQELMKRLKALKEDRSIEDFLEENFPEPRYKDLKHSVIQFVQGYDAADTRKASAFALRDEWEREDDDSQYRPENGYGALIEYLANECIKNGGRIVLSQAVTRIHWQKGHAEVFTQDHNRYTASKVLVTIPLGILQAGEESEGIVSFSPALPWKTEAARQMGFGPVIKIILQCRSVFWEEEVPHKLKNAGFIFSDAFIPTWWTQLPRKEPVLTGWLAGPKAGVPKDTGNDILYEKATESLALIFGVNTDFIRQKITASVITNWTADPFTRGAYSYATLQTKQAREVLCEPVENTLFFAGEALYKGPENGTVEGALVSGMDTAELLIKGFNGY